MKDENKGFLLEEWLENGDNARLLQQEELILSVTEQLFEIMEKEKINHADLARLLGKSRAYLTQVLSGSRNMTLRTLSDLCYVLKIKPCFVMTPELSTQEKCQKDKLEWPTESSKASNVYCLSQYRQNRLIERAAKEDKIKVVNKSVPNFDSAVGA